MTIIKWFIILLCLNINENVNSETSSAIPKLLQECYRNNFTVISNPPKTLSLLLELIRKIEYNERSSLTLRTFTSSLLHSVVFDGIRKSNNFLNDDNIIPYAASGDEFSKYKLIVDYLTPNDGASFRSNFLEIHKLCFLHNIVSDTIDSIVRGDEDKTCIPTTNMPFSEYDDVKSKCPIKQGVIKTRWGPIAPSRVFAAVAANLESQNVKFQRIEEVINNDLKNTTNETNTPTNTVVNTMWVSTVAGDLAEVILKQATENLIIGTDGFWNNTLLPKIYYLRTYDYQFTNDEILGGIDGIIIAENAKLWHNTMDSIRLSQLIDMYYNRKDDIDNFYTASSRLSAFSQLLDEVDFKKQVQGSAKLLRSISNHYDKTLSDHDVTQLLTPAMEQFQKVSNELINNYDIVENINDGTFLQHTPMEIIIIMDGTYDSYTAQQFIYTLADTFQVSIYGSRIGIINGQSANWLTNITTELFELFIDFNRAEEEWPATLSLGRSLETVIKYYENKTTSDCSLTYIKPISKSILVFSSDGRLTDTDLGSTKLAIKTIKGAYPETNIVYISQDLNNAFTELATNDYENDYVIKQNDIVSLVNTISDKLSKVPADIFLNYCNHAQVRFEDYITSYVETYYAIHREYVKKGVITTKFKNYDYGDIQICATTSKSNPYNKLCKNLTVNAEISFNSEDLCSKDSTCDLYYIVTANNSKYKCAENDCRYPDQIRLTITYSLNKASNLLLNVILLIPLFCIISIIN